MLGHLSKDLFISHVCCDRRIDQGFHGPVRLFYGIHFVFNSVGGFPVWYEISAA